MRFIKFDYIKLFNTILFIVMFSLLGIQLILTVPGFKALMTEVGGKDSMYAMSDTDEPYLGEITLELEAGEYDGSIIVLQNGEPVAAFFDKSVKINITDNTVLEIDGTDYEDSFKVKAVGFSSNVINNKTKTVSVNQNIEILDRYFLK